MTEERDPGVVECYGCVEDMPMDQCKIDFFLSVEPKWYCGDCRITLGQYFGGDMTPETNNAKPVEKTTYPAHGAAVATKSVVTTPTCQHHLTPFTFKMQGGEVTVYLTGSSDTSSNAQADWPDAGVYLSSRWFTGLAAVTDGVDVGDVTQWPSAFVNWPDRGVVDTEVLMPILKWAADKILDGQRVEIACMGGHGRTGTFTTALMVYLGWDVRGAFDYLRAEYCGKAVESREQVELLMRVAKLCQTS